MITFRLDEFIVDAYPIYENDDILNMITNFSTIVKLINGTASVFNDTLITQILGNFLSNLYMYCV